MEIKWNALYKQRTIKKEGSRMGMADAQKMEAVIQLYQRRPERRKKKEEPTEKVTADNEDILTLRKEADSTRHGRSQQSRDKLPGSAVIVDDIILLLSDGPSIPFLYA
jgi:hypothetical protein